MTDSGAKNNIILICTDHFRDDAVGVSTPNIMALAADGVRFVNAYCASPLCQPSRNSLITGLYPSQTGICGNQHEPLDVNMRRNTFMNHLRAGGYHTTMIGKHHYLDRYGLGIDVTADDQVVREYGFDDVVQVLDDGENRHNDDEYTKYLEAKGLLDEFRRYEVVPNHNDEHFEHPFDRSNTVDGFVCDRGVEFINQYDDGAPFYLFLSFIGPHPPLWHPGDLGHDPNEMSPPLGADDTPESRLRRAHYMDRCVLIDECIGDIVATIRKKGIYDDTVVIFTSDHGDTLGDHGVWDKRFMYESSVGVPMILKAQIAEPGSRMDSPRASKALVSQLDLYPTILGIAGLPTDTTGTRMGKDMMAMLRNEAGSFHDEIIAELATTIMIRTPNWKLVFDPQQGGVQYLFNLAVDSDELENLAGVAGYETVTSQLVQRLLSFKIRLSQHTHVKEKQRLQRVHIGER